MINKRQDKFILLLITGQEAVCLVVEMRHFVSFERGISIAPAPNLDEIVIPP
jgi:hypothetical protein